jgi:hypothetical protein
LRNSTLIASSLARVRFLIVLRPMTNEPHLCDRAKCQREDWKGLLGAAAAIAKLQARL